MSLLAEEVQGWLTIRRQLQNECQAPSQLSDTERY